MELHESLYALGRSQGRELFNDADSFRGALDDYLDEQSASTGDINLLVDAVRLGAFHQLSTMIDSGADPDRAVAEAGARLARDRGSADVGGSMWACAALGYAIGKVSDAQVRRFRTQHSSTPSAPQGPPTVLPPSPPVTSPGQPPVTSPGQPQVTSPGRPPVTSPPGPATPAWPSSGPHPQQSGSPGGPPPSYGQPGQPYPYGGTPPKKRRAWPILVAAGVVLVVIAGGLVTWLVTRGGEEPDGPGREETSEGPSLEFGDINDRYSSLGNMVTSGVSECTVAEPSSGETEKLECTLADGTLTLTTYDSEEEVKAARARILNTTEGTIVSDVESGAFYSFDPTIADENSTEAPILYWDSAAGHQSAMYTGGDGVDVSDLRADFNATSPTVQAPTGPVALKVKDLVSRFSIVRCERIPTEVDGETEESLCRLSTRPTYVGQFATVTDFRSYRQTAHQLSQEDGFPVQDYWYIDDNSNGIQDAAEPEQGKIYGYVEDGAGGSGKAVLFIDDLDCRCYLQMYGKAGDTPTSLYNLVF